MTARLLSLAALALLAACGAPPAQTASGDAGSNVGRAALAGGAPEIALQVSDNILARTPADQAALLLRADALVALGREAEATPLYRTVLAATPNSAGARLGLGRSLLAVDAAAAEEQFLAALAIDPGSAPAANNLGIARDLQQRHAEAQIAYRRALAAAPTMQAAAVNLALSLGMSGQAGEAIPLLRPIAQAPGATPRVRHDFAALLAISGDRAGAAQVLAVDLAAPDVETALDMFSALRAPRAAK
jgi:Flp pilus assembly protein TadD